MADAATTFNDLMDSPDLTKRQDDNIRAAYEHLKEEDFLTVAPILAGNDLDGWTAFEVCKAVENGVPTPIVADIASAGLDHRAARGLRHLAETITKGNGAPAVTFGRDLFRRVVSLVSDARADEQWCRALAGVLVKSDFSPDHSWLDLNREQLRSVEFALGEGVNRVILARYATGELPSESMDMLTMAIRDELNFPSLVRLIDVAKNPAQLAEAWTAAHAHARGTLSEEQLKLICNPALPQPTMHALRLALMHHGLPTSVAATVTAETTPDEVWALASHADELPKTSPAAGVDITEGARDAQPSSLRSVSEGVRDASRHLMHEDAQETANAREDDR